MSLQEIDNLKTNKHVNILLVLFTIIPMVSDWSYRGVNFSDLLLFLSVLYCIHAEGMNFLEPAKKYIILIFLIVFVHNIYHILFNNNYDLYKGGYFSIKLILYSIYCAQIYLLVKNHGKFSYLLSILMKSVIFIIFSGLFINILLLIGSEIPINIIWYFTRSDLASYTFRGTRIVRMRSLFSEPSYLGVYLNLALFLCLFVKITYLKNRSRYIVLFSFASFLTFSFSSILTTIVFLVLRFILMPQSHRKKLVFLLSSIILVLMGIVFMDQIYQTVVIRFYKIITGVDTSTIARIFGSWSHIPFERIIMGNGVGMTPAIWNNFAYVLSDFGIIVFIIFLILPFKFMKKNFLFAFAFIWLSFLRGGYLNPSYVFLTLTLIIYCIQKENIESKEVSLEVLVTTLNLQGVSSISAMNIQTNTIVSNQASKTEMKDTLINDHSVRIYTNTDRGVGISRNLLLSKSKADYLILADDDMVFSTEYNLIIQKVLKRTNYPDILIFNLMNSGGRFETKVDMEVNKFNYMRFGAARLVLSRASILKKTLFFNLLFGGGAKYQSGEDTIFLKDALNRNLRIIAVPEVIASLTDLRQSTWYEGHTKTFFHDKGVLFKEINPVLYPVTSLRFCLKNYKKSVEGDGLVEVYKNMVRGSKSY